MGYIGNLSYPIAIAACWVSPTGIYSVSASLGSYDLALSRQDHDLVFPIVSVSGSPEKHAIWPINGADKVAQEIKINLLTLFGEWFLDITWGVPYLEEIMVKDPHMPSIETIFRSHILDVPHVTQLTSFNLTWDRARRTLTVNFAAVTDYGIIQDSVRLDMNRVG